MADEGQTNFLRSILLLIEGGSYISRAIINRESTKTGRDINSLLGDFKTKLEHEFHGKQYQKLFPDTGEKTDINRWDLQLLIGVICIVFRKSISRSEKKDLLVIKQLRNDVFMHGAYASLDEEEYEEVIEQLEDSLNGLASTFEESVQEVCFTFIKNFKSGPLDALRPSIAALNGLSQTTQRKFTVGVSTELAVDGPSKYWTELCEDILETILNAAISRNESDGLENIRTKVTKMLEYLLANVDIVFQGCMRACIILKFECNSYEDMLYLLNKLDSWEHRYHLNKISNALTKEHKLNGLLNITSRVTTECLQSILIQRIKMLHEEEMGDDCLEVTSHTNYENKDEDKETYPKQDSDGIVSLKEDVRKPLKLGLECKSKEGLMHMLNLFKGNELQVHLKDVADALSEHVRKKVTLKTSLNIEDFMSAFEEAVIAERYEDRQLMTFVSRPDDISEDTQQQSESPIMEETFVPTKQEKLEINMEVPGKLSDQDSTLVCLPCERDGLKERANGFCQDCQEHLCETCYKNHRLPRPLKDHVLFDKDSMPKTWIILPEAPYNTMMNDLCQNHQEKPLEFYCNNHNSMACHVCVTLEHRDCQVDYIPDVSKDMSDEMNSMFKRIESLIEKCKSNIKNADWVTQSMDKSHDQVVEEIQLFRKEMNEYLDQMEASIIGEAVNIKQDAQRKQETIKTACEEITEELKSLKSLLNTLYEENKRTKLFIEIKNAENLLITLTDEERQALLWNTTDDGFRYARNTIILDKLKTENSYGKLSAYARPSPNRTIEFQYTGKVNVKSSADQEKCEITGMVMMPPSKMIVADRSNKSIKMIDVEKNSVETEIRMSSKPIDIITLSENKLAVTMINEKCIQILSCDGKGFSLGRKIVVGETCYGLANYKDKIVVTCCASRSILILSIAGDVLSTLDYPDLFYGPVRVLISNDERFVYITDTDWSSKSKVLKMDWKGNVQNVFEEPGYNVPCGIQQLEDETLLVCYRDSDTLMRLSSSLNKCEMTGLNRTNICSPKALGYICCDKTHKLYVTYASKGWLSKEDVIKVFKINWL